MAKAGNKREEASSSTTLPSTSPRGRSRLTSRGGGMRGAKTSRTTLQPSSDLVPPADMADFKAKRNSKSRKAKEATRRDGDSAQLSSVSTLPDDQEPVFIPKADSIGAEEGREADQASAQIDSKAGLFANATLTSIPTSASATTDEPATAADDKEERVPSPLPPIERISLQTTEIWLQCDYCGKWRAVMVPKHEPLPKFWYDEMGSKERG